MCKRKIAKILMAMVAIILALIVAMPFAYPAFAAGDRRPSGDNQVIPFAAGESVAGAVIEFEDHSVVYGCYQPSSQLGGQVKSGVVNPWTSEVAKMPFCFGPNGEAAAQPPAAANTNTNRLPTGDGKWLDFSAGTPVAGALIVLASGKQFKACYFASAPENGKVNTGVVSPWNEEVAKLPPCS